MGGRKDLCDIFSNGWTGRKHLMRERCDCFLQSILHDIGRHLSLEPMLSSVSFHETLHTTHTYGDFVDEEGFCHIECRKLLWWTPEEEWEIGRAYEAVVYLMESGKHDEESDSLESGRGLEKRTEEGAWNLYETQRDFRNAVLCEQDRLKGQGVTDMSVISEQLAAACASLSKTSHAYAHRVAQADAKHAHAYLRSSSRSSKQASVASGSLETKTSPLKSAAPNRVVPWVRHVSMPLTDTIETKALKASVEDKPVDKADMTLAAKSALEGRQKTDQTKSSTGTKKKKKTASQKKPSDPDEKPKKVKKMKKKSNSSNDERDPAKLEEEIRALEKQVAMKEAEKARKIAKKMSFGFDDDCKKQVQKKDSPKKAATLPDTTPSRRTSIKGGKSTKRKSKGTKTMGSSLSDLNASSDFSTVPPESESSVSSFDGDQELLVREVKAEVTAGRSRRQLSLFPKLRRKLGRKQEDIEDKASCHF